MAHQPDARSRGEAQGAALKAPAETIAAIATPPGRGGIGVVRVSGARAREIAQGIVGGVARPRHAALGDFRAADGTLIDRGITIFFPAPHSYTGEDVVELQGHGGAVVMRRLLSRCIELGARLAEPGEFTRRAFLNDRIDLAQAESVADLIDAATEEAARSAARSLAGELSRKVGLLLDALVELRMHIEACIDFPDEEIDPADRQAQSSSLERLLVSVDALLAEAGQGAVLREGLEVVLIGAPNVGKSSLLNRLAGDDLAIVTPIPGTTRDYVRASVSIEGVPIHLIDTAGLRETRDEVERIGVQRTWQAVESAGAALFVTEGGERPDSAEALLLARLPPSIPVARVINKIDLRGVAASRTDQGVNALIRLSAKTGAGVDLLRGWLLDTAGWKPGGGGVVMARGRHIEALKAVRQHLLSAAELSQAFELQAEELRLAQQQLGRITGSFTADDLLGQIFARFCIGK